jgi:hypothetical protein
MTNRCCHHPASLFSVHIFTNVMFMAKYGKAAEKSVARAMHEMKEGDLRSGRSGKKVTDPKQAVAIGLSEARARGAKVPSPKKTGRAAKKRGASKKARKRSKS